MEGKDCDEVGLETENQYSVENSLDRSMLNQSPSPESCHDSCYDSDSSSPSSAFLSHEDVSRTVSDTLGAERDDVINLPEKNIKTLPEGDVTHYPDYESKVEYTIKLGYKEHHLQEVLQQCGPDVGQNELLNELIKVSEGEEIDASLDILPDETESLFNEIKPEIGIDIDSSSNLRPIVIDGSNVALSHGNKKVFSCRGIEIAVDWFRARGHSDIKVIIPSWRKEVSRPDAPIADQDILFMLEKDGIVVFTPSRRVAGKRVVCYDDRYTVKYASEVGGIIVSNDIFRDLMAEDPAYKKVVEERLLQFTFINDRFMPPDDPLGRKGPSLDNFLRKEPLAPEHLPPLCPYDKKCTYGNKCKFYHPERGFMPHKSVTEKLAEQAKLEYQKVKEKQALKAKDNFTGEISIPKIKVTATESAPLPKRVLSRTKSGQPTGPKMQLSRTKSLTAGRGQSPTHNTGLFGLESQIATPEQENQSLNQTPNQQLKEKRTVINRQSQGCGPVPNITFGEVDSAVTSYPPHWITAHEDLKYTVSEPIATQEQSLRGHLALAKKLSDEGRKEEKTEPPFKDSTQNGHKKLNRQLSLKGAEDPRIQQRSSQPKYYFGNDQQAIIIQDKNQNYDFANQVLGEHRGTKKSSLGRKQPLSKKRSEIYLSPCSETQMTTHNAVLRMSSAPSKTVTNDPPFHKIGPKMERQNSTSDPQLYIPNCEEPGKSDVFADQNASVPLTSVPSEARLPLGISYAVSEQMNVQQQPKNFLNYPPPVGMSEQNLHFDQTRQAPLSVFNRDVYSPVANFPMTSEHQKAQMYGMHAKVHAHSNPNIYGQNTHLFQHKHAQTQQNCLDFGTASLNLSVSLNDKNNRHLGLVDTNEALLWGNSPNVNQAWPEPVVQDNTPNVQRKMKREGLYFHLCGLFPNEKVGKVMQDHPDEMDPAVLCKYILSL